MICTSMFPGIEYTAKGEKRHLPFEDSDMKYAELLRVLKDYNVSGMLICESPVMEEDALAFTTQL